MLERYTPLHLAAHYNPHDMYEMAAVEGSQQRAKEDGGSSGGGTVEPDGASASTSVLRRQVSCEETVRFIMEKDGVEVSPT